MDALQTINFDQAKNIIRRHASGPVTLVTPSVPGVSVQMSGTLYVQDAEDQFAFAISAGENLSVSVLPFPQGTYQIPQGEGEVQALICAMGGSDADGDVLLWMLRFE